MKRIFVLITALLLLAAMLGGCGSGRYTGKPVEGYEQFRAPEEGDTVVTFTTDMGVFKVLLFPEYAPMNVDIFVFLAQHGYYNNLPFHRVLNDFIIQSGGPANATHAATEMPDEFSDKLHHFTGALAMYGGGGAPTHMYYIVTALSFPEDVAAKMSSTPGISEELIEAYRTAYGAPHLDYDLTVIGQVYEGLDVVIAISQVETDELNRPINHIMVKTVEVSQFKESV